jgi:LacI family transcriptional regulator
MATMVEVARLAGVSISTVSHVLNGTRHVESATRSRVESAIERTGYRQDTLARAMRRARTESIGLVVSDAGEPAFADMVHGVEQAAAERGLTLLLANSAENAERERRAVYALLDRRVDGLILARAAESDDALLSALEAEKSPVVLLDRLFPALPFDQVGADNRESMRQLVEHLTARGHRKIAVIAGDVRVPTLRERYEGFGDGIGAAGLALAEQVAFIGRDDEIDREALGRSFAARAVTAVVACSTPLAVIGLEVARDRGLAVPGDLAFATFDGFHHSDLFEPRLTTVRQPAFDMGVAAVSLIAERLAAPTASPRIVRLQQRLELRDSTTADSRRGV